MPLSGQSGQIASRRWFSQMVTDTHCRLLSPPSPLVTLRICKKDFYENIPKRRTDITKIRETGVVKSGQNSIELGDQKETNSHIIPFSSITI